MHRSVELTFALAPCLSEGLGVVCSLTGELCAFVPLLCINAEFAECRKHLFSLAGSFEYFRG